MNGLGFPGDFLDSVVRFLDFPLENVEEGYPGDNCRDDGWFEELQTMPPNTGFSGSDVCVGGGVVKSELPSYSNGSQPSYIPREMSSCSTPPNVPPSNLEAPSAFQISIPASVLESNCSSSSNFNQELATQAISSTSSPSEKYNPLDASLSLSKLSGDIGSYHLPINPTRKPCPPSTYDRQHLPPSIAPSSASGKTNPLGTKLSISKLTGDMGSYRSLFIPRSKRSSVRKRKSRKVTLLFGCMDREKSSSQIPVASRGKIMPKRLSRVPVVFGSMDQEKNCSQKPVATSTKTMPSKLLQERVTARRCTHCEISNTPQWRHGPMGPKTLCNACGVRYRSGRLFPEYRPAASPTFVASLHSNTHTEVMEIRNKSRNMPKKLSRVPVVSGTVDREKNCSQKPVATSTKIMPSKLLQERVTAQRCTHCEISNTPQWRHGPMGPKTLCNACGVRYRSGRLFTEYRPAASPTFVASLHSNTHTEVMEIRNKSPSKVAAEAGADAAASPPPEFVPMSSYLFD